MEGKRARLVRLVGLVGLALALYSCERPEADNTLVIGVDTDIATLLPVVEQSLLDGEVNDMLYLGLNSARWENGALEYIVDDLSLAERWEFSSDSKALTYYLRSEAVWSDGQPVRAADVVFTYEVIRRPEVASPFGDSWESLDSVVALDERRVTFFFDRQHPRMLFQTGVGIIPAHIFESSAEDKASLVSHPTVIDPGGNLVVNGPFQVAEWRPGERLVLVPNPRAFTASPRVERVVFRIIPEEVTRLIELKNGDLDVINPLDLEAAQQFQGDGDVRIETIEQRFYDYVAWNGAKFEAFNDPEVRRALSLAIDREAILEGIGITAYTTPAGGPYPPIFRKLTDASIKHDPYLPDSARAILAERGWIDNDGDGVLDREGRPFRFTLLTRANQNRRVSAAQMIQAQFSEIGIDMEIQLLEFNALLDIMFESRDFEAVLLGWGVGLDPGYLVGIFWPPDALYNITGYASPVVDSLIALAEAAPTEDGAAPHWQAVARQIARDRPYAFLWFFDDLVAVSSRVHNTRIDTYGGYQNLYEWTLRR